MGANTKIEWCDHSWNPWVGCTKVSRACDHCYAESWAKRTGQAALWNGERRRTTEKNWLEPLKWNRRAEAEGRRARVFCASLADVFDNQVPSSWRDDLWRLIWGTPSLDWLLLTKRPQNIPKMLPNHTGREWPYPNVWLGTTVENQEEADRRIPHLLASPAVVHFLSCEPLLSDINIEPYFDHIAWVIVGGESGAGAREMRPEWARLLRKDCADYGIAFFMKQMTKKATIPPDLMVRQFPTANANNRT